MALIDIDLDDFDTDEIIEELERRLKQKWRKDCKTQIREFCNSYSGIEIGIEVRTLHDQMKVEHFSSVFKKYSISELQKLIPE